MYRSVSAFYRLIPLATCEQDVELYMLVNESALRDVPNDRQTEEEVEARRKQIRATVEQCVALKPGFVAPSLALDKRSLFADYFAVAMLLAD